MEWGSTTSPHSFRCTASPPYGVIILVWWPWHHPNYLSISPLPPPSDFQPLLHSSCLMGQSTQPKSFFTESSSLYSVPTVCHPPQNAELFSLGHSKTLAFLCPWWLTLPFLVLSHLDIFTWSPSLRFLNFDHYKIFQNKNFFSLWCVCSPLCFKFIRCFSSLPLIYLYMIFGAKLPDSHYLNFFIVLLVPCL